MPGTEIKFEFNIIVCFGISLAPYDVFSTRIYPKDIARAVESERPINTVLVCPSVRPSIVSLRM